MTEEEILHAAREAEALADQALRLTKGAHGYCKICRRPFHGNSHICIGEDNETTIVLHCQNTVELMDAQFRKGVLLHEAVTGRFDSHDTNWYIRHLMEELADAEHYVRGAEEADARKDRIIAELQAENKNLRDQLNHLPLISKVLEEREDREWERERDRDAR